MHPSPPIFWEVVLSDARESTNRAKRRCHQGILFWNSVFLVKKGSYTTFNTVKIRKIRKTWSMTKKKVIRNFGRKNVIQKSWSAKNVSIPPNSAPGLRHCLSCSNKQLPDQSGSVCAIESCQWCGLLWQSDLSLALGHNEYALLLHGFFITIIYIW